MLDISDTTETAEELIVPRKGAEVFEATEGQRFRIIAHEGVQVSDLVLINSENSSDTYSANHSIMLNQAKGIGNFARLKELYSRAPDNKLLATVT